MLALWCPHYFCGVPFDLYANGELTGLRACRRSIAGEVRSPDLGHEHPNERVFSLITGANANEGLAVLTEFGEDIVTGRRVLRRNSEPPQISVEYTAGELVAASTSLLALHAEITLSPGFGPNDRENAFEKALHAQVDVGEFVLVFIPDIKFSLGTNRASILAKILLARTEGQVAGSERDTVGFTVLSPVLLSPSPVMQCFTAT